MKTDELPDFAPSLAALAGVLRVSTSTVKDIRARDSRFPARTAAGYSVLAVAFLIEARRLERMTDARFRTERRGEFPDREPATRAEVLADCLDAVRRYSGHEPSFTAPPVVTDTAREPVETPNVPGYVITAGGMIVAPGGERRPY